jgi:hypothetical protein
MDQSPLVEMQIVDGAKIIERLREKGFDVPAAWWMKTSEEGQWFLYIASKEVDDLGITAAYRKVHSLIRPLEQLWVDRFEVKLVGPENPITQDVLAIFTRYGERVATRYGGNRLGNVSIDGAYLYPPPPVAA